MNPDGTLKIGHNILDVANPPVLSTSCIKDVHPLKMSDFVKVISRAFKDYCEVVTRLSYVEETEINT